MELHLQVCSNLTVCYLSVYIQQIIIISIKYISKYLISAKKMFKCIHVMLLELQEIRQSTLADQNHMASTYMNLSELLKN